MGWPRYLIKVAAVITYLKSISLGAGPVPKKMLFDWFTWGVFINPTPASPQSNAIGIATTYLLHVLVHTVTVQ